MQPGQIALTVGLLPISSLGMGENPSLIDVMSALRDANQNIQMSEVTNINLNGQPAARVDVVDSASATEGFMIIYQSDENTLIGVAGRAYTGYLAANEPLLLEMAAQVTYTAPTP